jgi:hypothetical protein
MASWRLRESVAKWRLPEERRATTSCPDCSPPPEGTTCTNQCAPNEYALICGGPPPIPLPDGSVPVVVYQEPPAACRPAAINLEGQSLCCPCE